MYIMSFNFEELLKNCSRNPALIENHCGGRGVYKIEILTSVCV